MSKIFWFNPVANPFKKLLMRNLFILTFLTFSAIILPFSDTYAGEKKPYTAPILAKITQSKGFSLPIDCQIGENCWVMNYVDFTPDDSKQSDPACLSRTYDTHKGTDFAILDGKAMEEGVNVIVPLKGIVTKIRDGEPDQWSTKEQRDTIKENRKECGNAVIIDHGNEIQTIYCHLKNGSITVKPNQSVKIGDKIGEVGLSGVTQFPHLHFGILKNKKVIDPFTGKTNLEPCGQNKKSLWKKEIDLHYQPFTIQSTGFSDSVPNLKKIEKDNNNKQIISDKAKIFTFWAILLGVREGDIITLEIKDPNGKTFSENKIVQDKTRAQQFYYVGKNLKNKALREGAYTGFVKIIRKDKDSKDIKKDKISSILVTK